MKGNLTTSSDQLPRDKFGTRKSVSYQACDVKLNAGMERPRDSF